MYVMVVCVWERGREHSLEQNSNMASIFSIIPLHTKEINLSFYIYITQGLSQPLDHILMKIIAAFLAFKGSLFKGRLLGEG